MTQIATRYGALEVPDDASDTIVRFLREYGEWAYLETALVASVLPARARVLDVGAFVGTFGLGLCLEADVASLVAVEANPAVADLLARNLERNGPETHVVEPAAVTGDGTAPVAGHASDGNLGSMSFTAGPGHEDGPAVRPVAATSLAQLRDAHGPFDLVKLDVEGMEAELLRSAQGWLADGGTALWVECNESAASLELAELLLGWGGQVTYVAFPSYNPDNANGSTTSIYPFAFEAGLLYGPSLSVPERLQAHGCRAEVVRDVDELKRALWLTPRWGRATWEGLSQAELAAVAAHEVLGETYDDYLGEDWESRRQAVEQASRSAHLAEGLALSRLAELEAREQQLRETADALARAERLALERLAEVERHERRAQRAESALAQVQTRLLAHLAGDEAAT